LKLWVFGRGMGIEVMEPHVHINQQSGDTCGSMDTGQSPPIARLGCGVSCTPALSVTTARLRRQLWRYTCINVPYLYHALEE